ncbi:hypothetical protein CBR_g1061 [Chara braunii]|uniref:Uncharacterized protein n=1 Tax=Chara braunii TaxID=69332 RepID=A0A388KD08_CHABU|nr:hypothetical protein CBR_g1061 [Chara braunii]|eukprot:GBG67942.1 hypothetical protein CBR_g1061 [Chara braunii]
MQDLEQGTRTRTSPVYDRGPPPAVRSQGAWCSYSEDSEEYCKGGEVLCQKPHGLQSAGTTTAACCRRTAVHRDHHHRSSKNLTDCRSLLGKLRIVTGGGRGIGLALTKELVRRGAHVVIATRSAEDIDIEVREQVLRHGRIWPTDEDGDELQKDGGGGRGGRGSVEFIRLDLSSFRSVLDFSHKITSRGVHVDVLINNAGIMAPPARVLTEDGLESQLQVNYLAHFLLTRQLLLKLLGQTQEDPPATAASGGQQQKRRPFRVVSLTSSTHHCGNIHFADLNSMEKYHAFHGYTQSKLAVDIWTKELQRRYREWGVTAVSVHPGLINTPLARQFFENVVPRRFSGLLRPLFPLFLNTTAQAVETLMYAVMAPAEEVGGAYVAHAQVSKCGAICHDLELAAKLWSVSLSLVPSPPA